MQNAQVVAGGPEESIGQPGWSPDGELYFVTDRSDWWNLARLDGEHVVPVCPRAAEFGQPQWSFAGSTWAFIAPGEILAATSSRTARSSVDSTSPPVLSHRSTCPLEDRGLARGAGPRRAHGGIVDGDAGAGDDGSRERRSHDLRKTTDLAIDPAFVSVPEAIEFATEDDLTAHAFFYRPANGDTVGPEGERPPLLVMSHGGPTGATEPSLRLGTQFWTSRGFAVLDVNYGGSTGYGRAYRERCAASGASSTSTTA